MYVSETVWFKRQQKRKERMKKLICSLGTILGFVFLCLCGVCLWQRGDFDKAEAADIQMTDSMNVVTSLREDALEKAAKKYDKNTLPDNMLIEEEVPVEQTPLIIIDAGHGGEDEGCCCAYPHIY